MAANLRFSNALLRRMLPFLLLALIFAACSGDDGRPAATATAFQLQPIPGSPMPTQTVLATATAAAARTPEPTTTASPTRTPAPGVGGLSLQPQLREVDRVIEPDSGKFRLVAAMTGPGASEGGWRGETGRIDAEMLARYVVDPAAATYYIAGPPAMVKASRELLSQIGTEPENIRLLGYAARSGAEKLQRFL